MVVNATYRPLNEIPYTTRSSADADNRLDAFSSQSRSIAYVTFILAVCCRSDATGLYILRHYLTE